MWIHDSLYASLYGLDKVPSNPLVEGLLDADSTVKTPDLDIEEPTQGPSVREDCAA